MRSATGIFSGSRLSNSRNCSVFSTISGSPSQILDQRVDRGGLGLYQPEVADVGTQVVEDLVGPDAAGGGDMLAQQVAQVLRVGIHVLVREPMDVDELMVVAIHEVVIQIEHETKPASEAGAEVQPGAPEHTHHAARHVLAAVVPRALDDRDGPRVTHCETLAGLSGSKQL